MRVNFSFADVTDLTLADEFDIYRTQFDFPDEIKLEVPNYKTHIEAIVSAMSQLTQVSLAITCTTLDWHNQNIKLSTKNDDPQGSAWNTTVLGFEQVQRGERVKYRYLKILFAVFPPFESDYFRPTRKAPTRQAMGTDFPAHSAKQQDYLALIDQITAHCLFLLNQHPSQQWRSMGFHPYWMDKGIGKEVSRRISASVRIRQAELDGKTLTRKEALTNGLIYVLQQSESGLIHIGYSTNPNKHLKELNESSPYPLHFVKIIEGNETLEHSLHERFDAYHVEDKWFLPADDLLAYIESLDQC